MTVWVVENGVSHEGGHVIGVYRTEVEALAAANRDAQQFGDDRPLVQSDEVCYANTTCWRRDKDSCDYWNIRHFELT